MARVFGVLAVLAIVAGCNTSTATPSMSSVPSMSAVPSALGSFTVTLANVGPGHRGGPGSYSGQGEVDCSYIGGIWHASFNIGSQSVDNIHVVVIAENPPAYVQAITTFDTDSLDWQVQNGAFTGTVVITVVDKGTTATLTAHAADNTQKIDATLSCTSVVRG